MPKFYLLLFLVASSYCACDTPHYTKTLEYEPVFIDFEQRVKGILWQPTSPKKIPTIRA